MIKKYLIPSAILVGIALMTMLITIEFYVPSIGTLLEQASGAAESSGGEQAGEIIVTALFLLPFFLIFGIATMLVSLVPIIICSIGIGRITKNKENKMPVVLIVFLTVACIFFIAPPLMYLSFYLI